MSKKEKELEQRIETLEKMVAILHIHSQGTQKAINDLVKAFNNFLENAIKECDKFESKPKQTPTDPLTKTLFRD